MKINYFKTKEGGGNRNTEPKHFLLDFIVTQFTVNQQKYVAFWLE